MRVRLVLTAVCALVCVTAGCGQSEEEKRAEEMKAAAEQLSSSAGDMAKGLEDMAKGLGGLAGGTANSQPVEPVSFRDMQTTFGEMDGWERGTPTGERMTVPVSFSRAEVDYRKGDSRIQIEISDSAFNQMLVMPYAMFLTTGYEKQTEDGYERSIKIGEYPGWEEWNTEGKDGELNAIVAKRFIVQVNGRNVDDVQVLHAAMTTINLAKLASLK
jgi:hypothetical protein